MKAHEIAAKLTRAQREAWANAEWCGDYFLPPVLPFVEQSWALQMGLICNNEGVVQVMPEGADLIMLLNRPTLWQRVKAAVRAALLESETP